MSYRVVVAKSVQKQINQLPDSIAQRVIQKIQLLAGEPRPVGCVKLKGYNNQYRVRVGDYRIRYEIDETELIIRLLQCKHRRDVYR